MHGNCLSIEDTSTEALTGLVKGMKGMKKKNLYPLYLVLSKGTTTLRRAPLWVTKIAVFADLRLLFFVFRTFSYVFRRTL